MKKKVAVLIILTMVMALAACGKKDEPSNSGNTETTKAADSTKEAEPTKAAEVTKEAEPTKAEEPTKAAEPTKEPETTPEATATPTPVEVTPDPVEDPDETEVDPEEDEFYSAGHDYDGIYVSDYCTLIIDAEGAADIFSIYYGRNDNRSEWDEWYEFWTNYSEEDKTFTANGGYHRYADPDKDTESDEDTVTFVVSGEKIICPELGNMEFICANEGDFMGGSDSGDDGDEYPDESRDALGNASWVMEVDKSGMCAKIAGYTEFIGDNYLAILNFYEQYKLPYSELVDKEIGEIVELSDGNKVKVYGFFTQGDNSDFNVKKDTYTDGCRVVVVWENPEDIFTQNQLDNMGYYSDPDNANFGFVLNNEDGLFYGYDDWAWDDCYSDEQYLAYPLVKLVVSPNTVVESAYSFDEDGNRYTFTGPEYLKLRDDPEGQESLGVKIYDDVSVYVTEITDASGRSTGEISLIREIYSP